MTLRLMIMLCAAVAGMPADAGAESLADALTASLQVSRTLAAASEEFAADREDIAIARSGYFPKLSLSAGANMTNVPNTGALATSNTGSTDRTLDQHNWDVSADIGQPLFDGFRTDHAVGAAQQSVAAAEAGLRAEEEKVLLAAVRAFVAVLRERAAVALRRQSVRLLTTDLADIGRREQQGDATRSDADQTAAHLAAAEAGLVDAEGATAAAEASFEVATGHRPGPLEQPPVPRAALPASLDQALTEVLTGSPEAVAALHRELAAEHEIAKAEADLMPQVSLHASYSRGYDYPARPEDNGDAQVTVRVDLPIDTGGETLARIRKAKLILRARKDDTAAIRNAARLELEQGWSGFLATRRLVELSHAGARASGRALQDIQRQHAAGECSQQDVLTAEQEFTSAKLTANKARYDMIEQAYAILATLGGLKAGTVAAAVAAR